MHAGNSVAEMKGIRSDWKEMKDTGYRAKCLGKANVKSFFVNRCEKVHRKNKVPT